MTQWTEEVDPVRGDFRVQLRVEKVLFERQTEHQHILLIENKTYGRVLLFDGIAQVSENDQFIYHEMLAHVPVMAHGAVRSALVIGGGDGGAVEELFKHRDIERVDMVEIDPVVIEMSKEYLRSVCGDAFEDPRLRLTIGDGVEFVADSDETYDIILVDSNDPTGETNVLYSEAFYRHCSRRLAPGGVLVTQNALPFFDRDWLRKPITRLRKLFADVGCYQVAVPSFYGGFMAFGWASSDEALRMVARESLDARFASADLDTHYYTPETHLASFALPPYVSKMLA
jgi:spermidine synthase